MRTRTPEPIAMRRRIATLALVCLAAMAFAPGCAKREAQEEPTEQIVLPVSATPAVRGRIEKLLSYTGSVDAVRRVVIAPAVPGRIERIRVEEGQRVKAGQILVNMDDKQLAQARAQYGAARSTHTRMKALHERGSATDQQFEQATAAFEASQAGYQQLLESVELRAPFTGTIIGKYYNDGEIYSAMIPGPEGLGAILSLAKLDRMKVEVRVPEQDYVQIREGMPAYIGVDVLPEQRFVGTIARLSPALDMRSRTATATIEVHNGDALLRPGMFARVHVVTQEKDSALVVPATAVVVRGDSAFVFTVAPGTPPYETTPRPVPVEQGIANADFAEVSSDALSESDLVLVENNVSLTPETAIRVVSIAPPAGN